MLSCWWTRWPALAYRPASSTSARGPAVTRYELQPTAGVKISRITGLADDIALSLATTGVRIEAPIPNKAAVGIEVPNRSRGRGLSAGADRFLRIFHRQEQADRGPRPGYRAARSCSRIWPRCLTCSSRALPDRVNRSAPTP